MCQESSGNVKWVCQIGVTRVQVDETNMSVYSSQQACLIGVSSGVYTHSLQHTLTDKVTGWTLSMGVLIKG